MLAKLFHSKKVFPVCKAGVSDVPTEKQLITKSSMYRIRLTLLVALFGLFMANNLKAQTVTVNPAVICAGSVVTVSLSNYSPPAGLTITGYEYDLYGDGTKKVNSITNGYPYAYPPGTYTAKVVVKLSNGSTSSTYASAQFDVYNLPIASFTIVTQDTQCFRGNSFQFTNQSGKNTNTPSNNVVLYYWNYGDARGDSVYNTNPVFHSYNAPGRYDLQLRVYDDKGCRKDTILKTAITVKKNISPKFKWTFVSGPCFVSCYKFQNLSAVDKTTISKYEWDFGDGSKFNGTLPLNDSNYDAIMHCYTIDGEFYPQLTLTDNTGCTDSLRQTPANSQIALPKNIKFVFDVTAIKSPVDTAIQKDSVCAGTGNISTIYFRMTPVSFAQSGAGDFVWNFGDPNDPNLKNLDSMVWTAKHLFSGPGQYFPSITIKNVCPDTTYNYYSSVTIGSKYFIDRYNDLQNDTFNPGASPVPIKIDSMQLTYTGQFQVFKKNAFAAGPFGNPGPPVWDTVYIYQNNFSNRPHYYIEVDSLVYNPNGTVKQKVTVLSSYKAWGYGVSILGPATTIEIPPLGIVVPAPQKDQCGPSDTVSLVHASSYYKSRKVWTRWDFGDDFAPKCTSFSEPKRGMYPAGGWPDAVAQYLGSDHFFIINGKAYPGRMNCQYSYDTLPRHYYINWDTAFQWYYLGHDYFPWDTTRYSATTAAGKITIRPGDKPWWGKPVYLNIGTGEWSLTQDSSPVTNVLIPYTYVDPIDGSTSTRYYTDTVSSVTYPNGKWIKWPRIDTMKTGLTDMVNGRPINYTQIPDPIAIVRGKSPTGKKPYPLLSGSVKPGDHIRNGSPDGDSWDIYADSLIPPESAGETFYRYAFNRAVQKCITITLEEKDSFNNESSYSGGYFDVKGYFDLFPGHENQDSSILDPDAGTARGGDCGGQSTVQLHTARGDARGLSKGGRECPGTLRDVQAEIHLSVANLNGYPGTKPECGQTFILFNYDSLADRQDLTPCDLDGFVTWQGGFTPGGFNRPPFFSKPDFNPLSVWTSPGGTEWVYHYGPGNTGTPAPADTVNGNVTVGLAIGSGCKDTTLYGSQTNIKLSDYRANPAIYEADITAPINGYPVNTPSIPGYGNSYTYKFNGITKMTPLTPLFPDTLIDLNYVDCNYPRCISSIVWYHNFLKIINVNANFTAFPTQLPGANWKLRGVGEKITVYYEDSTQEDVMYSQWEWGDATLTVDSFFRADSPATATDGYYVNGIRRVRYNWDILDPTVPVLMDSTVWPIRASGIGATDGLQAGIATDTVRDPLFYRIYSIYNRNYKPDSMIVELICKNDLKGLPPNPTANDIFLASLDTIAYKDTMRFFPVQYVRDTALMFLPVEHTFKRTSWEAANVNPRKGPDANIGRLHHFIQTTKQCYNQAGQFITIGIIDTFFTLNSQGVQDDIYCENEEILFYDSVRYWRYDTDISSLPFNPGRTRNPTVTGPPPPVLVFDPTALPEATFQIDSFDFWRHYEHAISDTRTGMYGDSVYKWNPLKPVMLKDINGNDSALGYGNWDTLRSYSIIYNEKIYWNFGDGNTYAGVKPFHQYETYGRYKVTMVSRDSLGFLDTCIRYVNIVKPVGKIGLISDDVSCGAAANMFDSSYVLPNSPALDSVENNYWWFGEKKTDTLTAQSFNNPQPQLFYHSNGKFTVKLVVETYQGCYDTTYRDVFVQGPRPRFRVITDTIGCAPFKVKIVNMADSFDKRNANDLPTQSSIFYWGDNGNFSAAYGKANRDTLEYVYNDSGTYEIFVMGSDAPQGGSNNCPVVYFPDTVNGNNYAIRITVKKFPVNITANKTQICVGDVLQLTNSSDTNFTAFRYKRYLPTGNLLDSFDNNTLPTYTFNTPKFDSAGTHQIIGYPIAFGSAIPVAARPNCSVTDTVTVGVNKPYPAFDVDTTAYPKYSFINQSTNAAYYEWTLFKEDGSVYDSKNGNTNDKDWNVNLGNDTGNYVICLKAITIDSLGLCPDSVCKPLINEFIVRINIPNVYSPDGDGMNDVFKIDIEGETKYDLVIFNRWGGKVFESKDSHKLWDGTNQNDGSQCPSGVYYFIFNYQLRAKDAKTETGTVTLIR